MSSSSNSNVKINLLKYNAKMLNNKTSNVIAYLTRVNVSWIKHKILNKHNVILNYYYKICKIKSQIFHCVTNVKYNNNLVNYNKFNRNVDSKNVKY